MSDSLHILSQFQFILKSFQLKSNKTHQLNLKKKKKEIHETLRQLSFILTAYSIRIMSNKNNTQQYTIVVIQT